MCQRLEVPPLHKAPSSSLLHLPRAFIVMVKDGSTCASGRRTGDKQEKDTIWVYASHLFRAASQHCSHPMGSPWSQDTQLQGNMGTAVFIQGTLCPAKKSMVVEEVERDLWETASNSTDEKNKAQTGEVTCPRSPSHGWWQGRT